MRKFIGRVAQKRVFAESVSHILLSNKKGLLSRLRKKPKEETPYPRLFLFYGEGGLGKSMLVDECIRVAEEKAKENNENIKVIKLDWDDYYNKKSTLPDDDTKMIAGLYTVFSESLDKPGKYFEGYIKKQQDVDTVNEKVDEKRKDFSKEAGLLTSGVKTLAGAHDIPVPDVVGEVIEKGLSTAFSTLDEYERKFRKWLRDRKVLPENDITLYENSNYELSTELVKGVLELSENCPLLLAVDTYERVDNENIEEWFRTVFLKKVFENHPRLLVILSGRNNHLKPYRNQFPDDLLHHTFFDDILFTGGEIKAFTDAYNLNLGEEDIDKLEQCTQGVPIVVAEVCNLLTEDNSLDEVLESFEYRTDEIKDIIRGVVDRFLKYCDPETRERVFHLAMLRHFNDKFLSKIWEVSTKEVAGILSELSEKHSFVHRNRMHAQVRQFIRSHLVNEINSNIGSYVFEGFEKSIIVFWADQLEGREKGKGLLEDIYTDRDFQSIFLDYIDALMWVDREKAFDCIAAHFLEFLEFNSSIILEILKILEEFNASLSGKQKRDLTILTNGLINHKPFRTWFNEPPEKEEMELIEFLETCMKSFPEGQKYVLYYKKAELYYRAGKYDNVVELLDKSQDLIETSDKIKKNITDIYVEVGNRYGEQKNYRLSLSCYNKALALNPEDASAYNNRGNTYHSRQEYEKALEDYTRAIEINPEYASAYNNRGTTYHSRQEYEKALEDYNRAIDINPEDASAYYNRGTTYHSRQEYEKALEDYTRAIEINPEDADAYYNRGTTYHSRQEYEKALEDYTRAIEINPEDASAYFNLSELYIIIDNYPGALETLQKASLLSLEVKYRTICIYLEGIARKMLDMDVSDQEKQLDAILKEEFMLTWSFKEIESWVERTEMTEDKKTFIIEKAKLLKEH